MTKRTTLADIARECDVSVATVSMVLRNKAASISPETRNRIRVTARTLGYTPRSSRDPDAGAIGVVIKSTDDGPMRDNPFYVGILAGIEDACRRLHTNLLYATLPVDENNCPTHFPRLLNAGSVEGLIVVGVWVTDALLPRLDEMGAPVVLADAYLADLTAAYDSVESDNYHGAYGAVTYLLEQGHRDIGLLSAPDFAYPSISARREGYRDAMRACTDAHPYSVTTHAHRPGDTDAEVERLLQTNPRITAVFACNDNTALAVMRVARRLGRRIPEDLSLIGFDDIELARHIYPALTTMHVDTVGMGRMAAQLLTNRLEFPDAEKVTAIMRPRLIERQSVAALPVMALVEG